MRTANDTTETADKVFSDVCRMATDLLSVPITSAQRVGGSGNNRVYSLRCDNSRSYVIKFYFCHPADKRDRLEAEFASFSFLSGQGISDIPRPIAVNRKESCAIYEFIEGKKIGAGDAREEDVKYAVDFVANLKRLNKTAFSHNIPPASDACFSIQAVIANVEGRLDRLGKLKSDEQEYRELESFLADDFKPFFSVLKKWAREQCAASGISLDTEIPLEQRTLSPSDFGFHNALRANDGRIVFLDFEYFGWDDPTKMIADFLFHPAMALSEPMKEVFVRWMLDVFEENSRLIDRFKVVYPLFGLKWCMIFLNEFIPSDFTRRAYAAGNPLDKHQVRKEQLHKARDLYRKLKEIYLKFPYANQ